MSIIVNAAQLAKGWLSVSTASASEADRPALDRTVYIEQHTHGLRLTATDSYILLAAWVPEVDYDLEPEPSPDEIPYAVAVTRDPYGRGAGLLAHLLRLARAEEKDFGKSDLAVTVKLNVPWQSPDTATADLQLDGFTALAVTLEHPDNEKVQLTVFEGDYPHTQTLIAAHRPMRTERLALSGWVVGHLAKAAKVHGPQAIIRQTFGGKDRAIGVEFGDDPLIYGLVMPCRWDLDNDRPFVDPSPDES